MENKVIPISGWGFLSLLSLSLILINVLVFLYFLMIGERGGMGYWDNLKLAIPGSNVALFGFFCFIFGLIAFFKDDSAVSVIISFIIGLLITIWVVLEIIFPH